MNAALDDAEDAVARTLAERRARARGPAHRERHRAARRVLRRREGRAFVERHGDVGIEEMLDLDRALGRQAMLAAVEMRAEDDAALVDLAQGGERHHLKAAGIGEDRRRPVHEAVKPALCRDALRARPQHEMIGVAEDDLRAGARNRFRQHRLDGGGGADRHEGRGVDRAMRRRQHAAPRRAVARADIEPELRAHEDASARVSRQASP